MKEGIQKSDMKDPGIGCRMTKRLLGQILIDGEFVLPNDITAALERQSQSNELLGEILVGMGALDPKELHAVLSVQKDFIYPEDAVKAAAGIRQLFGELLVRAKRIEPSQLDAALKVQNETGEKLGHVLLRMGLITGNELKAILAFQQNQGMEAGGNDRLKLGELLVATRHITKEQLQDALLQQKISKKKIGEVLIEAGYAEPHHIQFGLNLQRKLVTAALIAAIPLASIEKANAVYSIPPPPRDTATVTVTARVLAHASIKFLYQAPELVVTNSDIAKGYLEVKNASLVELKNNNPEGYMLFFEATDGHINLVKEIQVQGLGREVQIDSYGGWILLPNEGLTPVTKELSYRFVLSEKAQPGSYHWPIALSVRAIQ